jgi:hypothetical protein
MRAEFTRCTRSAGASRGERSRAVVLTRWRESRWCAWEKLGACAAQGGECDGVRVAVKRRESGFYDG